MTKFWRLILVLFVFVLIGETTSSSRGWATVPLRCSKPPRSTAAGRFKTILKITVPLMTPLIFYNMVIAIINSFQTFVPSLIMTDGGPENSTLFVVLNIYRNGFQFFNMGYASALAWVLFAITFGFTLIIVRSSNRWVYYEGERG